MSGRELCNRVELSETAMIEADKLAFARQDEAPGAVFSRRSLAHLSV